MRAARGLFIISLLLLYVESKSNDSLRVISYPRHIQVYAKIISSYSQIEIEDPDIKNVLLIKPNVGANFKIGFYYSWLGLGYSFILPAEPEMNRKFGKTRGYSFDAHFMKPKLMLDFTMNSFKGYYLSNPEDFVQDWNTDNVYPQSTGLETFVLSASFAYVFKPERFSPTAAYSFTKSMRRRGGSWVLGGFASLSSINSDSSIVSSSIRQYINPQLNLKDVTFSDVGISFGYSYLLTIFKKNFLSISFMPGVSYQRISQKSAINESYKRFNALSGRTVLHFSVGRNGDKYYWGLAGYIESSVINNLNTKLTLASGYGEFFLGYRINTDNWKIMKRIDKLIHPHFLQFITGTAPERD